jgi:hypothetical protein
MGLQNPLEPPLFSRGTPHHVIGRVERGACSSSLAGATLKLTESWYTLATSGFPNLVLPARPPSGPLDPLSFTSRPLVQGRALGQVVLASNAENFDVLWLEVSISTRVPWVENVHNGRTGEIITVYRILKLDVSFPSNTNLVGIIPGPVPLIMFFGTETTKNIGTIKVNCFSAGG